MGAGSLTLSERNAPTFAIIGAQKAATTWLWDMLDQHPGTSLPSQKEIHYFGSAELYARGDDWYYSHFKGLDPDKLIGEASTSYIYDRVPYWHNKSNQIDAAATIYHSDLRLGRNVFVAPGVLIIENIEGGSVTLADKVVVHRNNVLETGCQGYIKVAAGSRAVVTKDIPAGAIAAGNPARIIKHRNELTHPGNNDEQQ